MAAQVKRPVPAPTIRRPKDHTPSAKQIAADLKAAKAWARKNKVTKLPPDSATWSLSVLIPLAAMPKGRVGRPPKGGHS